MVKAKRGKKAAKDGSDDSDVDQVEDVTEGVENLAIQAGGTKNKPKKKTPTQRAGFELLLDDDDEDSSEEEEAPAPSKASGKGKGAKKVEVESDEEEQPSKTNKAKKKGKKAAAVKDDSEGSEEEMKPKPEESKGGKKAKRKKKKDESDEDIEKILAELQMEYSGQKAPSAEPEVSQEKKKEKTKPEKDLSGEVEDETSERGPAEESSSTVKSAAQKKREKKEKKKQAQKQGGQAASENTESLVPSEAPKPAPAKLSPEEAPPTEGDKAEEQADDEGGKKKKGKKGAVVEPKEDKKAPKKNKMIAAIQEQQRKIQEEEERLRKVAEEEEARLAAIEAARLEAERLETERKERKKKKEKERKERLKAEGKLLTPKQKADRARAQAMLEALGVAPPQAGEKKLRPGTRIRPSKQSKQQMQQAADENTGDSREGSETPSIDPSQTESGEQTAETPVVEEVKDTWDAESDDSGAEDKKAGDKSSPKAETAPVPALKPTPVVAPAKEESESSSEEEGSEEDSDDSDGSDVGSHDAADHQTDQERKRAKAVARIQKRRQEAEKNRTADVLRAAVICVLGHVDTGKTKILDKLRRTSVQAGEAGGITQQIGATNVPIDAIKEQTKIVKGFADVKLKLPGLLIIDTPGHASFSNLRSRGSSLCDMAILVVDIMHGLEEQTLESINLLKSKKTPFVVALNKIDRLYDWTTMARKDIRDVLKAQASNTQTEFERRTKDVILQFAEQGLNAALFYENPDPRSYVSLVPTSAITGEGMGNLLALLVENCQNMLVKRLMYSDELQATVLEVKAITGLGTTIDCILVNGRLREGDTIVLASSDGNAIVTQIRSLLMPQPMKELRVKNDYIEFKEVKAAQGVKIAAKDLEKAIAGLNMLVAQHPDEVDLCKEEVVRDLARELGRIKLQATGVLVQASTLGSLEALLEFLKDSKIPYSSVKIGPVVKKDVMRAASMLERESQYGTILAFDVKVERDAQEYADSLGVKIFQADIIYHLFDQFTAHREQLRQSKRQQFKNIAVFPCKLRILPQYVFNSRDPIVVGVIVEDGIVCVGTPICVHSKELSNESGTPQFIDLGVVSSIENNHKAVENARRGHEVCVKIESIGDGAPKMFGRHFDEKDLLISKISRQSIDACKDYFREDLLKSDWQLMVELKKIFQIL